MSRILSVYHGQHVTLYLYLPLCEITITPQQKKESFADSKRQKLPIKAQCLIIKPDKLFIEIGDSE